MKAIILSRVSSKEQEEGHSLQAQSNRLKEYCTRKGLDIIEEFTIVESSTRGGRPEFNKMVDFIKKSKVRLNVVVDAVDRLQRGFKETPIFDDFINTGKIRLHFLREAMVLDENSKSSQKIMWDVNVIMAKGYVGSLSDNVKRSQEKKLAEGTILGESPIGYLNLKDGKGGVELDPDRAFIIKKLFEEYSTGLSSITELHIKAKQMGLRSKQKPYNLVSKAQLHNMLQNPFYYGAMRVKGKLYPHFYTPLISKEMFDICQNIRGGRGRQACSENTTTPFIFRGLVKCKNCGRLFTPELKKGKYIYLRAHPKNGCNCKSINEEKVLKEVRNILLQLRISDGLKEDMVKTLKQSIEAKKKFSENSLSNLVKQKGLIQTRLDNLLNMRLDGSITKDDYDNKAIELREEQADLNHRINNLDIADEQFTVTLEYLLGITSRAFELFESSTIEEKRKLLNFTLSNLEIDGENVVISIRKPFDKLLNMSKGLTWLGWLEPSNIRHNNRKIHKIKHLTNLLLRANPKSISSLY